MAQRAIALQAFGELVLAVLASKADSARERLADLALHAANLDLAVPTYAPDDRSPVALPPVRPHASAGQWTDYGAHGLRDCDDYGD